MSDMYISGILFMAQPERKQLMGREITHKAAEFVAKHSNRQSLITVLWADVSPEFSHAVIYVSVFPETQEKPALDFLKRVRGEFRTWIAREVSFKRVPTFDFAIDVGEKNRQVVQNL